MKAFVLLQNITKTTLTLLQNKGTIKGITEGAFNCYTQLYDEACKQKTNIMKAKNRIELFNNEVSELKCNEQLCQYDKMCVRKRIHIECPSDCKDDTRLLA